MADSVASIIGSQIATKVPAIPAATSANLLDVAKSLKQIVDVREGLVGNPLDANITFRDLLEAGAVTVRPGWNPDRRFSGGISPIMPPWVNPDGYDPTTDMTPPPKPVNAEATGLFALVQIQWEGINSYRNHAYAELWRAESNVIGNALLIGTSDTQFYTDNLGTSATRYYWVRFVSQANVKGPFQGVDGMAASTATDPALVLQSLTNQITESHLYQDLGARINLIDGPDTLENSVAARIAAEAQARAQAIQSEANARTQAINLEAGARALAISAEAQARTQAVGGAVETLQGQIDTLVAASSGDFQELFNVVSSEQNARIEGDTALASSVSMLASISGDSVAAIREEQNTRAGADSSTATSLSILYAGFGDNNAAILAERSARSDADSAAATQLDGLRATTDSAIAGLVTERNVSANESSALASQVTALSAQASDNTAAILIEQSVRVDELSSLATQTQGLSAAAANSSSAIQLEQLSRASENEALSSQVTTVAAATAGFSAGLQVEQYARTSADEAAAAQVGTLSASVGDNYSAISSEQLARVTADVASATQISGLTSVLNSSAASLAVEQTTRATEDSALSEQIFRSFAKAEEATAAIVAEQISRADAEGALASQTASLAATFGSSASSIVAEQNARANADGAFANQLFSLSGTTGASSAGLVSEQLIRTSNDEAAAERISSLAASTGANTAGLAFEQFARTTSDSATAGQLTVLSAVSGSNAASITTEQNARTSDAESLVSQLQGIVSSTGANIAGLQSEISARTLATQAVANSVTTLQATVGQNTASISAEQSVRASETGDLFARYGVKVDLAGFVSGFGLLSSGRVATDVATGVNWGAVSDAVTRAIGGSEPDSTKFNEVFGGRKLGDTNNSGAVNSADALNIVKYWIGITLETAVYNYINVTLKNILMADPVKYREYLILQKDSATSEFAIRADRFYVAPPSIHSSVAPTNNFAGRVWVDTSITPNVTKYYNSDTSTWSTTPTNLPFIVQATSNTLDDGTVVAPGVYINAAFIADATITSAKIANAAIDNAKIANLDASKITAGTIAADRLDATTITSKVLTVDWAKITNASITSAQIADAAIGSANIASTIQSTNWSATNGWQINKAGTATFNQVALRGSINSGAFTAYAWPEAGTGFHLGPLGLLLGNYNVVLPNGKRNYFQIQDSGNLYAPGFSIVDGDATFSGTLTANIVKTNNIENSAVTSGYAVETSGASCTVAVSNTTGATCMLIMVQAGDPQTVNVGSGENVIPVTQAAQATINFNGTNVSTGYTSVTHIATSVPTGNFNITAYRASGTPGILKLFALLTKR